jgi:hypothetical protein
VKLLLKASKQTPVFVRPSGVKVSTVEILPAKWFSYQSELLVPI